MTQSAERVMRASCNGSGAAGAHMPIGARIAPPIPDPRCAAFWPARQHELEATARGLGLEPNHFFLYAGNLDPYQDLPLLTELARARAGRRGLPIVLATHDPRARTLDRVAGVRVVELARTAPLQALVAAARATLVPRRALGGFPIKLANSLALGTPAIAFHADEWGLADGRDALIADRARPVHSLATALDRLERDAGLAERLRVGARATWARQHAPGSVAEATLDLIERVQQAMRRRRTLHDDATHDDAMTAQGSGTSGPRRAT